MTGNFLANLHHRGRGKLSSYTQPKFVVKQEPQTTQQYPTINGRKVFWYHRAWWAQQLKTAAFEHFLSDNDLMIWTGITKALPRYDGIIMDHRGSSIMTTQGPRGRIG